MRNFADNSQIDEFQYVIWIQKGLLLVFKNNLYIVDDVAKLDGVSQITQTGSSSVVNGLTQGSYRG